MLGMSEAEYHAHPAFSASKAKAILDSPARFKWEYIDGNREQKKAFDVGSAVHAKVLGTGYPPFRSGPITFARDTGIIDY